MTATQAMVLPAGTGTSRRKHSRTWPLTVLGIIFLAIMVFPIYWMINSSLQGNSGAANTEWFPFHPTFAGYEAAIAQQLPTSSRASSCR